jgi:hypothetical protein
MLNDQRYDFVIKKIDTNTKINDTTKNYIPKTDSSNDPKIIKHEVNDNLEPYYQLTLSYHKSPYKEEPVEVACQFNDLDNIG